MCINAKYAKNLKTFLYSERFDYILHMHSCALCKQNLMKNIVLELLEVHAQFEQDAQGRRLKYTFFFNTHF